VIPLIYDLAIGFGRRVLIPINARFRVVGLENAPLTGGLLVASNHLNDGDPGILCAAIRYRRIAFMTKSELFKIPVLAQFLRAFGTVPVRRNEADLGALRKVGELLKEGVAVCIFPEGTRSGREAKLSEAWPGTALVAMRNDALILPVAIAGSQYFGLPFFRIPFFKKQDVTVTIGEPFRLPRPERLNAESVRAGTQQIMERIAALLPPSYRGYYGSANAAAGPAAEAPESR